MDKLLPCPFCGRPNPMVYGDEEDGYWVMCSGCNAEIPRFFHDQTVAAWNTRVTAQLERELARAREVIQRCAEAPFTGWTIAQALARAFLASTPDASTPQEADDFDYAEASRFANKVFSQMIEDFPAPPAQVEGE